MVEEPTITKESKGNPKKPRPRCIPAIKELLVKVVENGEDAKALLPLLDELEEEK